MKNLKIIGSILVVKYFNSVQYSEVLETVISNLLGYMKCFPKTYILFH